ncbi:ABC transporter ATP-binding protein [Paenibacillus sp. GCM10027629]|uniref:ABC transporter ATP-binding protein n=1 Tax=Paenibacillus sp. GCM10027629 TaxID=3273414 RepID=UPI00362DBE53
MNSITDSGNSLWRVYRWVLRFLKPYRVKVFLMIGCGLAITAGEVLFPKSIQYFIDHIYKMKDYNAFMVLLMMLIVMVIVVIAAGNGRNMLERIVGVKASRDLQHDVFMHLRTLGFSYFERHPVGETLSLLNTEVAAAEKIFRRFLPAIMVNMMSVIVSITVMITLSWKLSLIIVPCFLLYYIFGPSIDRKASTYAKQKTQNRIDLDKKIYEGISGLQEFRAFARESWDLERTFDRMSTLFHSYMKWCFFANFRGSYRRFTFYTGAIALFIIGYVLIRNQSLTVGEFVAFILMYFTTMWNLTSIVALIAEQKSLMFQIVPLYNFMKLTPEVMECANPILLPQVKGEIHFREVSFGYSEGETVLQHFNLRIRAGERVAFVGMSGNGKSTALKLIGRFYDPLAGEVSLDGVSLTELTLDQLRESIGYVFQETYLFGDTVRENIRFGRPDATEEEIVEAAKAANAHDFILQLPEGYDTSVGERGIKLSGGQRQRISIARMLLKNPKIVLLDEATSALDNISEKDVQQALDKLFVGRTTIAVAHRLSTVQDYDRIVLIDQGRVVEEGSYEELMNRRGAFYQLAEGQVSESEVSRDEESALDVALHQIR